MAKAATKELAVQGEPKEPTEMTVVKGTTSIQPVRPAEIEVYEEDHDSADTGLDDSSNADRRLPIFRILQTNSPQCRDVEDGGLGAKPGSIMNTQTNEVFDGKRGLYLVASLIDHKFVNYRKRNEDGSGGGFVGILEPADPVVKQRQAERIAEHGDLFGKLANGTDDEGNDLELVETFYAYGIIIVPNDDGTYPGEFGQFFAGLLPFASTQIKKKAAWVERAKNMRYNVSVGGKIVPKALNLWSHVWHVRTAIEGRGMQKWYGWNLTLAAKNPDGTERPYKESKLPKDNPLYALAADLRVQAMEGSAQVAYDKDSAGNTGEGAASQQHGGGGSPQDDIPGL